MLLLLSGDRACCVWCLCHTLMEISSESRMGLELCVCVYVHLQEKEVKCECVHLSACSLTEEEPIWKPENREACKAVLFLQPDACVHECMSVLVGRSQGQL